MHHGTRRHKTEHQLVRLGRLPPEDSDGFWGYANMVGILADPDHPERDDHLERLGLDSADEFDPVAVRRSRGQRVLARLR